MNNISLKKGKTFLAQASVLKRLIAFIIDLLIINMIILFPFKKVFNGMVPQTESFSKTFDFLSSNTGSSAAITVIVILIAFLTILYFMLLEKKLNQTPGK
ncbi:MAG: RDD family protein, partial [Candidatus Woesearchaeota archaeon]|nr:RDD family protein [Candidatus Woesearchaeota archaeon]